VLLDPYEHKITDPSEHTITDESSQLPFWTLGRSHENGRTGVGSSNQVLDSSDSENEAITESDGADMPGRRRGRGYRDKRGRPRKLSTENVNTAREAKARGKPLAPFAAKWNVGHATVWRAVHPEKDRAYADEGFEQKATAKPTGASQPDFSAEQPSSEADAPKGDEAE